MTDIAPDFMLHHRGLGKRLGYFAKKTRVAKLTGLKLRLRSKKLLISVCDRLTKSPYQYSSQESRKMILEVKLSWGKDSGHFGT